MCRQLIVIVGLLLCLHSSAQQGDPRSIAELTALLKKSNADTSRVSLLLEAGLSYVLRLGSGKRDMDSALFYINSAMQLSRSLNEAIWEGRCNYVYSQFYRETSVTDKGRESIRQAIATFTKYDLKNDLGNAYIELGQYYDIWSDSQSVHKMNYYKQAIDQFAQGGAKKKQADALKDLGDFYQIYGQFKPALDTLKLALALYEEIGYPRTHGVYDLLGTVAEQMGDYKHALEYGLQAVKTAEAVNDTSLQLSTIYNRVGVTYAELKQNEPCAFYLQKALNVALKYSDTGTVMIIFPNITSLLLRLNKPKDALVNLKTVENYNSPWLIDKIKMHTGFISCYIKLNDYEKAEQYFKKLQTISKALDKNDGTWEMVYRSIIKYHFARGQFNEVVAYLPRHEEICRKAGLRRSLSDNYLWRFKTDSASGNYVSAIRNYQRYEDIEDSLYNESSSRNIAQLQVLYETDQKDHELRIREQNIQLLNKKSEVQEARLDRAKIIRNSIIAGTAMLLLLLGLGYNRYRLKQRSNEKLEAKQKEINQQNKSLQQLLDDKDQLLQEKEWLLKEIHHRVKNNLQMVMSLLNTQSAYLENEAAVKAIRDSQHRMQAISLIHKKLYLSENVGFVDMSSYINELVHYLRDSFDTGHRIVFEQHVELVRLDVGQAVPLGIILNEAITNSLKYAFPGNQNGIITVSLQHTNDKSLLLTIMDNGAGLPGNLDASNSNSLGINLMKGLSKQLNGDFVIDSNEGVIITIQFAKDKLMEYESTPVEADSVYTNGTYA